MNAMNFEFAHKQMAVNVGGARRRGPPASGKPVHRPSVALILLATIVQILAMAALLGTVANAL